MIQTDHASILAVDVDVTKPGPVSKNPERAKPNVGNMFEAYATHVPSVSLQPDHVDANSDVDSDEWED
jgi:hypothetical protein